MLDRTYFVPEDDVVGAYSVAARAALADVLEAFANAMDTVDPIATAEPTAARSRQLVETQLDVLLVRRNHLAELLLVDPMVDAAAWEQHGALLAAADRLRVEVEAAVRPVEQPWRPEPMTARHRTAVRRMMGTLTGDRHSHRNINSSGGRPWPIVCLLAHVRGVRPGWHDSAYRLLVTTIEMIAVTLKVGTPK